MKPLEGSRRKPLRREFWLRRRASDHKAQSVWYSVSQIRAVDMERQSTDLQKTLSNTNLMKSSHPEHRTHFTNSIISQQALKNEHDLDTSSEERVRVPNTHVLNETPL